VHVTTVGYLDPVMWRHLKTKLDVFVGYPFFDELH
jgi:hypothetical protein